MNFRERFIESMVALGEAIPLHEDQLQEAIQRSKANNQWFTEENISHAIEEIRREFLQREKLEAWLSAYPEVVPENAKTVGMIMAGNIPLVGFHDVLCVLASGHSAQVKLSEKDPYLLPFILEVLAGIDREIAKKVEIREKLKNFDAVIATGSNQAATHFENYFRNIPNIIRRNRNAVAVLTGEESDDDLSGLARDIFRYFGLGCRNVSKVYLPEGYDFNRLVRALKHFEDLQHHNKFRNNLDYNAALHIMAVSEHLSLEHIILVRSEEIASRIACLHYAYYQDLDSLEDHFEDHKNEIQCIVGNVSLKNHSLVPFGASQSPSLSAYADGIDTLDFLIKLHSGEEEG